MNVIKIFWYAYHWNFSRCKAE